MYDRGALDAEQDDLNHFYYQHYYYYRRGYDDARRQLRRGGGGGAGGRAGLPRPLLALAAAAALLAGLLLFGGLGSPGNLGGLGALIGLGGPAAAPTAQPAAATRPAATATRRPTAAPTATPAPTAAPALGIGARARVANLNGAPLRARQAPGLTAVVARIPEGSEVTLREGPVEADGYSWWRVEAGELSGWVAAGSPEGVSFLEPIP